MECIVLAGHDENMQILLCLLCLGCVSCQCINICIWKCSLLVGRWVSLSFISQADKKDERKTHIVFQVFLICKLKLAVCGSLHLCAMPDFWRMWKCKSRIPSKMLHPAFSVMHGENVEFKSIQLYLMFVPHSCSKINFFSDLVLTLWYRPCWDSSWNPLESLDQFL